MRSPQPTTELPTASQAAWLDAVAADRNGLLTSVFRMYESGVRLRARAYVGIELASDVTQEVFLRLWRQPERFDPARSTLATYLNMVARGVAIDMSRSDSRRRARDERAHALSRSASPRNVAVVDSVADPVVLNEAKARVATALSMIGARQRTAIKSVYFDDATFMQAARTTCVPEGTVKSRVRTGLVNLRPLLADLQNDGAPESGVVQN